MKSKIKLIILDAYGVTLTGGFPHTCKFIAKKFNRDYSEIYKVIYKKYFNQAAERKITQQAAWEKAIKELNLPITVKEIKKIHYGLMGLNMPVINFSKKINHEVKILLLSKNTRSQMREIDEAISFKKYFKNIINTWELKLPKASKNTIFYIAKKFNIKPKEMLFIDDQLENLIEAGKLCVKTIIYKNFEQFKKEVSNYLN